MKSALRIVALVCAAAMSVASRAQELAELAASDSASRDFFGLSVAISGHTIISGASEDDDTFNNSGSAYVFVGNGATWSEQAKLHASDARAQDFFGSTVVISDDTAVVAAYRDDHVDGSGADEGSAYVFVRGGTTWTQQAKLKAADAAPRDLFGTALALDGDTLVVGVPLDDDAGTSSGSVYVFTRSGTTWSQQAKLIASDAAPNDQFGISIALDGGRLIVGSFRAKHPGLACGAAYVFERSGTVWMEQAKLVASDAAENDSFGRAVTLSGNTAVIGAFQDDDLGFDSGSVYVFERTGSVWTERVKLFASDAEPLDNFGRSIALGGGTLVVGACGNRASRSHGQAYVFAGSGASWTQTDVLLTSESAEADFLGLSLSLSGATAVVGAAWDDDAGGSSGTCHVFWINPVVTTYCTAKTTSSGCTPAIGFAGVPSATATSGFAVTALQVESNKSGLLFYGTAGPKSAPFQGGTMCVQPPTLRTPVQNSGSMGAPPCPGVLALDLNATGICTSIGAGQMGWMQGWFRDPAIASTTGLTDGIEFAVGP